jgi:hypothetical protein
MGNQPLELERKNAFHLPDLTMRELNDALTSGQVGLTEKQRAALGGKKFKPRVREPGEALPRDFNNMKNVYKPPEWPTRTGR